MEVAPSEVFTGWQELDRRASDLGGRPVALVSWGPQAVDGDELFSRWSYGEDEADPPQRVLENAQALTAEQALRDWRRDEPHPWTVEHWPEIVQRHLDATRAAYGDAPALDEILAFDLGHDELRLERHLFDWENERERTAEAPDATFLNWFDPSGVGAVVLAVLPVATPEETLAYASFYGAEGKGRHERLIAIARRWRERYGAILWANWGTMLQFVVERPPSAPEDCFELASEQVTVAPCTVMLPGVSIRDHARVLCGRATWFLHERP